MYCFFIFAPCILTTVMFLSPTNALIYYSYKMLKYTVKLSHYCSYMFRSIWTIIRELILNLDKVAMFIKDKSLSVQHTLVKVFQVGCLLCALQFVTANCTAHSKHPTGNIFTNIAEHLTTYL